jgi:hypothetical protein
MPPGRPSAGRADFTGFPPAYLISGTRDLLLSDTVLAHRNDYEHDGLRVSGGRVLSRLIAMNRGEV